MAFAKISQFLFSLNVFKSSSWNDFFAGLSAFFGRVLYRLLICAVGRIADICQLIFRKLAGISPNGVTFQNLNENGKAETVTGDLVQYIVQSKSMQNILWAMLALAVVLLLISTFVATIKTEFAKDGNNNKRKVIKLAFRGMANFVLVPIICLFGLFIGNAILRAIDGATNPTGSQTTLSAQIFLSGGYNANRARQSETSGEGSSSQAYYTGSFGEKLKTNGANFGVFVDDTSGIVKRTAADKIDTFFANGYRILIGTGEVYGGSDSNTKITDYIGGDVAGAIDYSGAQIIDLKALGVWHDGAFGNDIKINITTVDRWDGVVVDSEGSIKFIRAHADKAQYVVFSIYDVGLVYTYYDLRIGSFDYLISFICLIFCAYTLLIAALGLVKRLFYLSMLFVISPGVCAIYPIDEGKSLERWRTEFIKYTLSAYSVVIVLNLFLALLPTLLRIELFSSWKADFFPLPIAKELANYLARVLLVIGGLTFFKDATKQLAAIIGAADANEEGNAAKGNFITNVGRTMAGVGIGMAAAAGTVGLAGAAAGKAAGGINNRINTSLIAKNDAIKAEMKKRPRDEKTGKFRKMTDDEKAQRQKNVEKLRKSSKRVERLKSVSNGIGTFFHGTPKERQVASKISKGIGVVTGLVGNTFSSVGGIVKDFVTGDIGKKPSEVSKYSLFKGSRERQKKRKEDAEKAEAKASDAKMKRDIAEMNERQKKQEKEAEDMKKRLEENERKHKDKDKKKKK